MEWASPTDGVKEKRMERSGQIIRLVEFSEGFIEKDWCNKGHIGYVLEGAFTIDFNGNQIKYEQGDGIWMEEGEANKHKALVRAGERALLILFEKA